MTTITTFCDLFLSLNNLFLGFFSFIVKWLFIINSIYRKINLMFHVLVIMVFFFSFFYIKNTIVINKRTNESANEIKVQS